VQRAPKQKWPQNAQVQKGGGDEKIFRATLVIFVFYDFRFDPKEEVGFQLLSISNQ
jgi:hypothetical protein